MPDATTVHALEAAAWQYQQAYGRVSDYSEAVATNLFLRSEDLDVGNWMSALHEQMDTIGNQQLLLFVGFLIHQFDLLGIVEDVPTPSSDWMGDNIRRWSPAPMVDAQNQQRIDRGRPIGEILAGLVPKLKREVASFNRRVEWHGFNDVAKQVKGGLTAMLIPQINACGFCIDGASHLWHLSGDAGPSALKSHNFCRCGWRLVASDEDFKPRLGGSTDKRSTPDQGETNDGHAPNE